MVFLDMKSSKTSTLLILYLATAGMAQDPACTTGAVGDLARYAQYDAVQIDCTRAYPQYNRGTTVTSTKAVTSGKTTSTSTKTVTGVRVTSSAPVVTVTVRTITRTTTTSTATSTSTVTAPVSTTTSTEVETETAVETATVTTPAPYKARKLGRFVRNAGPAANPEANATPVLRKRSREEEFMASLSALGTSSSAVFRTFCSCYETKGPTTTTTVTVPSTTTTTTTTTTVPTTTVTSTTTTTFTTTSTPVTTITSTTTTTPLVTETDTSTSTTTTTTTVTRAPPCSETGCASKYGLHCDQTFQGFRGIASHTKSTSNYIDCANQCNSDEYNKAFIFDKTAGGVNNCVCYQQYQPANEYAYTPGKITGIEYYQCPGAS